jgi:uncharacterized membrane protein
VSENCLPFFCVLFSSEYSSLQLVRQDVPGIGYVTGFWHNYFISETMPFALPFVAYYVTGGVNLKKIIMEKRVLGIILSILGIVGLIYAGAVFMNTSGGERNIKSLALFGILGLIFFVSGISLVRNTNDKAT